MDTNEMPKRSFVEKIGYRELGIAFGLSVLLTLIFYPAFFTMQEFPMGNNSWELQDPAVSTLVFLPALRAIRYEYFHHHSFLWSNLRTLGKPLLGSEIQGAPLFPLTLLLIGIPDPYFWNVFCILRLILISTGTFLFALQILKRRWLPAFVFTISFAFALFVVRWMNHAWQNGLLAGIWYLFFLIKMLGVSSEPWSKRRFGVLLGVAFSTYSILTCGFPESAAMIALLGSFILLPVIATAIWKKEIGLRTFLADAITAHFIGFAVASPQLFSVLEFIKEVGPGYRTGVGVVQFEGPEILWHMLTRVTDGYPPGSCIHYFHLIPLFLTAIAGYALCKRRKLRRYDFAALACLAFFVLKFFPVWPWFNQFVGNLPILSQSWFIVYFFTIPIFFVAYFAARGTDYFFEVVRFGEPKEKAKLRRYVLLVGLTLLTLLYLDITHVPNTSALRVLKQAYLFAGFLCLALALLTYKTKRTSFAIGSLFVVFLVLEVISSRPIQFLKFTQDNYLRYYDHARANTLEHMLKARHVSLPELRERSGGGDYVGIGLATIDAGSPPILDERSRNFREKLFTPVWDAFGAAIPLKDQRVPWAYQMASTNLYVEQVPLTLPKTDSRRLSYLGKANGFYVYHDPTALSRAYAASECLPTTKETALSMISTKGHFTLGDAVVENLDPQEQITCAKTRGTIQSIPIAEDRGSVVTLSHVHGPNIVVLNDSYYPGWHAYDRLSGKELSVHPANYAFRSVVLQENRDYEIEFSYRPAWYVYSLYLISLSIGILFALAIRTYFVAQPRLSFATVPPLTEAAAQ